MAAFNEFKNETEGQQQSIIEELQGRLRPDLRRLHGPRSCSTGT